MTDVFVDVELIQKKTPPIWLAFRSEGISWSPDDLIHKEPEKEGGEKRWEFMDSDTSYFEWTNMELDGLSWQFVVFGINVC